MPGDDRAVHRVAGPELVADVGFEPAEHLYRVSVAAAVQTVLGEEALNSAS